MRRTTTPTTSRHSTRRDSPSSRRASIPPPVSSAVSATYCSRLRRCSGAGGSGPLLGRTPAAGPMPGCVWVRDGSVAGRLRNRPVCSRGGSLDDGAARNRPVCSRGGSLDDGAARRPVCSRRDGSVVGCARPGPAWSRGAPAVREMPVCCRAIAGGTVWSLSPEMISRGPRLGFLVSTFASVQGLRFSAAAWNSGAPGAATWNVSCN